MEEHVHLFESLFKRVTEYGETSLELVKLKVLDKTSDVISSMIPPIVARILIASFLFFLSLGLAFWLGEILGKIYFGFFVVAAFYGVIGIFVRLFLYKWLKKIVNNYIVKQVLK